MVIIDVELFKVVDTHGGMGKYINMYELKGEREFPPCMILMLMTTCSWLTMSSSFMTVHRHIRKLGLVTNGWRHVEAKGGKKRHLSDFFIESLGNIWKKS